MRPRHIALSVALVLAAWLAWSNQRQPSDAVVEPAARPAVPIMSAAADRRARSGGKAGAAAEKPVDLLQDRARLIGGARAGSGAAPLFAGHNWTPPPPPPPPPAQPPPPEAPPLPFKFLGKKHEDNVWEVYLSRNDETFVVRERTVIESNYRVDRIRPPTMAITYLPLNQTQTLTIGGIE